MASLPNRVTEYHRAIWAEFFSGLLGPSYPEVPLERRELGRRLRPPGREPRSRVPPKDERPGPVRSVTGTVCTSRADHSSS